MLCQKKKGKNSYKKKLNLIINPIINDLELYINNLLPIIIKGCKYWNSLESSNLWVQFQCSKGFHPYTIQPQARQSIYIYIFINNIYLIIFIEQTPRQIHKAKKKPRTTFQLTLSDLEIIKKIDKKKITQKDIKKYQQNKRKQLLCQEQPKKRQKIN